MEWWVEEIQDYPWMWLEDAVGVGDGSFTVHCLGNESRTVRKGWLRLHVSDEDGIPALGDGTEVSVEQEGDFESPAITVLGDNPAQVHRNAEYVDAGAEAYDAVSGDLTAAIDVVSTVSTAIPGEYEVRYTVEDAVGNVASATRVVEVLPCTAGVCLSVDAGSSTTLSVEWGEPAEFLVTTEGGGGLKYQWYQVEGKSDWLLEGETEPLYRIAHCRENHAGSYYCEVHNTLGDELVNSPVFTLDVTVSAPAVGVIGLSLLGVGVVLTALRRARRKP